jgi:type II secretory pathway component PulF
MAIYYYRAIDPKGYLQEGYISGASAYKARAQLDGFQIHPITLRRRWITAHDSLDVILFLKYLGYALDAGYVLTPSVAMIQEAFQGFFKGVVGAISQRLQQGVLLSEACRDYPMIFPPVMMALIQMGETSGQLSHACKQAGIYLLQVKTQKTGLRKTLLQPFLNFGFFMVALIFLAMSLLPEIKPLFHDKAMPWTTLILVSLSEMSYGMMAIAGFFLGVCTWFLWSTRLLIRVECIGKYYVQPYYMQFFSALAILIQEKIPLIQAITVASQSSSFGYLDRCFQELIQRIKQGEKLYQALEVLPYIPEFYKNLIQVGEATGHQSQALVASTQLMSSHIQGRLDKMMVFVPIGLTLIVGGCFWFLLQGTIVALYDSAGGSFHGF